MDKIKVSIKEPQIRSLKQIKFDLLSADEIRDQAVCFVTETKLIGPNSVYDLRMGAQDKKECLTCEGREEPCEGHFGAIKLNEVILHPLYLERIKNYLTCFCQNCFCILINKNQYKLLKLDKISSDLKLKRIIEFCLKVKSCQNCTELVPTYVIEKDHTSEEKIFFYFNDKKNKIEFTANEIENVFGKIKPDDIKLLGVKTHPLRLIISYLPVLPPCSRPCVTMGNKTGNDDLTYKYVDIVKVNNKLGEKKLPEKKKKELVENLIFHVKTMFDNHKKKAKQITNKRPIKGIRERFVGKGGRFRHDLSGKRVDFSGRTVFDVDPNLACDQVGLPMEWKELTFPHYVNDDNLEFWKKEVNSGRVKTLIKDDGTKINLKYAREKKGFELLWGDRVIRNGKEIDPVVYEMLKGKKFVLQPGDKVKGLRELTSGKLKGRYSIRIIVPSVFPSTKYVEVKPGYKCEAMLQDGQWILFNRQPSLHKFSILAGKAKFLWNSVIRLNPSLCGPLNADSDGDELNIHVPQSQQAVAEASELISVKANLKGGRDSSTIITICQDTITSGFLMTTYLKDNKYITKNIKDKYGDTFLKEFVIIEKSVFFNALCCISEWDFSYYETRMNEIQKQYSKHFKCSFEEAEKYLYTGHGLFSMLLPNTLNITFNNKIKVIDGINIPVVIKNGTMLSGSIDKNVVGKKINSLIGTLQSLYDSDIALNFATNYQLLADCILMDTSFSVGIKDCFSKYDKCDGNDPVNEISQKEVDKCFMEAKMLYLTERNPDILEKKINMVLNKANTVGETLSKKSLTENNSLRSMIVSGSKGNYVNPAQIIALLGQRTTNGMRMEKHFKGRTLPHYKKNDIDMFDPLSEDPEGDLDILFRSRGFIRSSYIKGLRPDEFFFDSASGRTGILETAVKTSTTGYIARRLVKKLENYKISYNGTVVNQKNKILSFNYNDGFDPSKVYVINGKSSFCNVQLLIDKLCSQYELDNNL
jgi:DNA-directed RNA polymerase beta' subunit